MPRWPSMPDPMYQREAVKNRPPPGPPGVGVNPGRQGLRWRATVRSPIGLLRRTVKVRDGVVGAGMSRFPGRARRAPSSEHGQNDWTQRPENGHDVAFMVSWAGQRMANSTPAHGGEGYVLWTERWNVLYVGDSLGGGGRRWRCPSSWRPNLRSRPRSRRRTPPVARTTIQSAWPSVVNATWFEESWDSGDALGGSSGDHLVTAQANYQNTKNGPFYWATFVSPCTFNPASPRHCVYATATSFHVWTAR